MIVFNHQLYRQKCVVIYAMLVLVLLGSLVESPSYGQVVKDPKLQVRIIGGIGQTATNMAFIGPNDILVLSKNSGQVFRMVNGTVVGPVLDVNVVSFDGRGLLGIVPHPAFSTNGYVYLYYTKSTTGGDVATNDSLLDNRVERYTWNGSALVNPVLIVSLPVDAIALHVGGILTFGPDGKLYVEIGYLDRNGQLQNNSTGAPPDDSGVVLRLNDDGSIPADNPFFSAGGNLQKYFAYGIRNSFGMAFDPLTGKLWMTDNGDENYDEINLVVPGFNSGWAQLMGPIARTPGAMSNLHVIAVSQYADPKFSWFESVAPTGLVFLNSLQLGTAYKNNLFVADYNSGRLYRFQLNDARDGFTFQGAGLGDLVGDSEAELEELVFGSDFGLTTDLKLGPDGKLYLLNIDGTINVIERRLAIVCPTDSLQAVIDDALSGDTIQVSGTCSENILIRNEKQRIALDGGQNASISAASSLSPTINVRGKGISIRGFDISGGSEGILVNRGSSAVIESNDIHHTGGNGILANQLAFAAITNNSIHHHPGAGIWIGENSAARIGFNSDNEMLAGANMIVNNGVGVVVANRSNSRIVGNTISNNNSDGIHVLGDSQADIASNVIANNAGDGIEVGENSMVQLGADSGSAIFDLPNAGTGNGGVGIRCTTGGVVDGVLGSLTGTAAKDVEASCIDSL